MKVETNGIAQPPVFLIMPMSGGPSFGSHAGLGIVSDEDYIALLIGRIIMGWGLIDQLIYSEILRFHKLKIDDRFTHRLKHWRQLCVSVCQSDQTKISAIDRVMTKMKMDSLVRHHLAHGFALLFKLGRRGVCPNRPNLHIYEYRETTKRLRANQEAFKRDPTMKFW
ncbi:MAG TPA: hypothetical protein VL996_04325, partial [Methylocella sp.]|nr:hypothetical protein [Methylocella sp.]